MSGDVAELERPVAGLPDGWRMLRLGDVAKLGGGTTPSRNEAGYWDNGTIPWATPSDITSLPPGVSTIDHTESMVSERALTECSLPLNQPGTVLMTSRATIGYAAINSVPMTTNQGFITFSAGRDLDPAFLLHWLVAQRAKLVAAAGGSTFKELSRGTAKLLPILLPPLDEQRRIADVLRSVDEAIAAAEDTLDFCERLLVKKRRAAFRHFITEPDDDALKLGDICDLGRGFAFKSEDYVDEGVLNFRVTNVGRPPYDLGEKRFLPLSFMTEYEEYRLTGGEIVLVMVGATVGKLGRVPEAVCPALLNQNMWTLTAKKPFDQELLWHLAHALIEEKVHGAQGGAYSFLTKKDFLGHRIGRFNIAETVEAVAELSAMEQYAERLSDEVRQFHQLKSSLMSDLLSGRVRVPA
jgi:type I restriction enzyme S subunit